jgi:hypothetical protein
MANDPIERRRAGLGGIPDATWNGVRRRLEMIDAEDDTSRRTRLILRLDRWIETEIPALATYVSRVRMLPGMDELTEARTPVGTD